MKDFPWTKSSFCDNSSGNCVEVRAVGGGVAVRDSKAPEAVPLVFIVPEWDAFVAGVRAGEFDTI